jgi:hypothetical protein
LAVFVVDKRKQPLMPCSEKRARLLPEHGRAVVRRLYPFTVRLKARISGDVQPARVKLDRRRSRWSCCRARDEDGYRGPAVLRLGKLVPAAGMAVERVRFDMPLLERPEISDIAYQQGSRAGYGVSEYVFERFGRHCVYCSATDMPLNADHVVTKSRGGSNRVSNSVPACMPCKTAMAARRIEEFLADDRKRFAAIKTRLKAPLKDAAAADGTRWASYEAPADIGLPVEAWSGGSTKFNRPRPGTPKTHALDAAFVGEMETLTGWQTPTLQIKASGRDDYCCPRGFCTRSKIVRGFQTDDMGRTEAVKRKCAGIHVRRVAVPATRSFRVGKADSINAGHCKLLHCADDHGYGRRPALPPAIEIAGFQRGVFL